MAKDRGASRPRLAAFAVPPPPGANTGFPRGGFSGNQRPNGRMAAVASCRAMNSVGRPGRLSGLLRLVALTLLLPFVALSLVQRDTMLAADANGRVMVVLCHGDDPVEMAVAVDGTLTPVDELDPHGARDRHQPCNWTPHAQPTLGGGPTTLPLPPRLHLTLNLHPLRRDHVGLMPARVPAARGPPALA